MNLFVLKNFSKGLALPRGKGNGPILERVRTSGRTGRREVVQDRPLGRNQIALGKFCREIFAVGSRAPSCLGSGPDKSPDGKRERPGTQYRPEEVKDPANELSLGRNHIFADSSSLEGQYPSVFGGNGSVDARGVRDASKSVGGAQGSMDAPGSRENNKWNDNDDVRRRDWPGASGGLSGESNQHDVGRELWPGASGGPSGKINQNVGREDWSGPSAGQSGENNQHDEGREDWPAPSGGQSGEEGGSGLIDELMTWQGLSRICVHASTLVWAALMLPPILQACMGEGVAALSQTPWLVTATYAFCYTTLTGVFLDLNEGEASLLNAVGAALSFTQLSLLGAGGALPYSLTGLLGISATAGALVLGARAGFGEPQGLGKPLWAGWNILLALIGGGLLALGFMQMFHGTAPSALLFAGGALGMAAFLLRNYFSPYVAKLGSLARDAPAWAATVLFMLQAFAQLASGPTGVNAVVHSTLLCLAGNTLLVPRALATRDHIFFTGTGTCSLMYWAHLACCCCCCLDPTGTTHWLAKSGIAGACSVSLALLTAAWVAFASNARALGLRGPLHSITYTLRWEERGAS